MIEHPDQYATFAAEGAQIEADGDATLYASPPRPATIRTVESMLIEVQGLRAMIGDAVRANTTLARERDAARMEVASLRLSLGGVAPDQSVPEPIGCPCPGSCATVREIVRLRAQVEERQP